MFAGQDQLWLHKLLHHFRHARHLAVYNSNRYQQAELPMGYITFDWLIGVSEGEPLALEAPYLETLDRFVSEQPDYYLGFLSYELKNELEKLHSVHPDSLDFKPACFFRPELLLVCSQGEIKVLRNETAIPWDQSKIAALEDAPLPKQSPIALSCRTNREQYLAQVENIRKDIAAGTVYELNYCMEWFKKDVKTDPIALYRRDRKSTRLNSSHQSTTRMPSSA